MVRKLSSEDGKKSRIIELEKELAQLRLEIRSGKNRRRQDQSQTSNPTANNIAKASDKSSSSNTNSRQYNDSDSHSDSHPDSHPDSKPRDIIWEQWLIDTIKSLFEFSTEGAIDFTLMQLSKLLNIDGCCFHLMSSYTNTRVHHHWDHSTTPPWDHFSNDDCKYWLADLNTNTPLTGALETLPNVPLCILQPFRNCDITTAAVVPIQRRSHTNAYLCLFKHKNKSQQGWSQRELSLVLAIGEVIDMVVERQAMTARMTERDTRFQYAMEASRDGLWDWDLKSDQIYFSHSFLRMLGYEDAQLSMNLETFQNIFLHPDDRDRVIESYSAALAKQQQHLEFEYRMLHRNGSVIWIYARTKFVERDAIGKPSRVVGINANITHFKDIQEELLNAKEQADSANRTKSEFLNRMSHEIRTPMNAIIGMGHLLRDTSLNRQQVDYLHHIDQAANTLLHIIDKVLDFAKIDSDKIVLDHVHFDIEEVLGNLSQLTDIDAHHKDIEVIFDTSDNVPHYLRGDAVRLNQILYHLINNAIKFSEHGVILVKTCTGQITNEYIELKFSVADQGIGMSQQEVDSLFVPFTQADGSSSRRFGGTGLGLTICKHLVKLMHGHINIETQANVGSTITFNARFEHSHIGASTMRTQPRQFEGMRTLIVDDNDIARSVISRTANSLHLRSDTATCASDALTKIETAEQQEQDPYKLILMDWRMPEIDGFRASKIIKTQTKIKHKPAIIMISAYRKDDIIKNNNKNYIDAFINKPISQSRLFDAMNGIFSKQAMNTNKDDNSLSDEEINQRLNGRHLLLAEDNIVNQKVAVGMLKKKNVLVTIANNGREAVELLQQSKRHYDAILMDIEMPEMDGFQATKIIRDSDYAPHIPIIAITAQALKGDLERCLNAGMDGYISKPVAPATLYRTLAKLLKCEAAK